MAIENQDGIYTGANGTLILEAENGLASGVWERRNLDGQIAMLWDNPTSNYRTIDNDESLSFNFTVDINGTYSIALHAARVRSVMNNGDLYENGKLRTDTGNDSYVGIYDVAEGRYVQSPIKLYTGLGNVDEEFRWGKTFEVGSSHEDAEVALQAGREYRLDLIGRSDGYAIDRITFQQGSRELRDETSPESFYGDRGVTPPHGGSAGRDVETLLSGGASVPYYAFRGDDVITGSNVAEQIYGGAGNDNLMGQGGNDFIADTLGTNTLRGGGGHDVIQGGLGTTNANGDNGNDIILGGIGSDNLNGGAGNDTLRGDHRGSSFFGNDRLEGGSGRDFLEGGRGADVFVFTPNDNTNFIATLDIDLDDPLATRAVGADFVSGIDRVDLTAFGSMSFSDVQGRMTAPDGYALFSQNNTSIHFIGVDLEKQIIAG